MNVVGLIVEVLRAGHSIRLDLDDRTIVLQPQDVPSGLVSRLRDNKAAVVDFLRSNGTSVSLSPSGVIRCNFPIGMAGATCRRCNVAWIEHMGSATNAVTVSY